jgi:hypothetical protein
MADRQKLYLADTIWDAKAEANAIFIRELQFHLDKEIARLRRLKVLVSGVGVLLAFAAVGPSAQVIYNANNGGKPAGGGDWVAFVVGILSAIVAAWIFCLDGSLDERIPQDVHSGISKVLNIDPNATDASRRRSSDPGQVEDYSSNPAADSDSTASGPGGEARKEESSCDTQQAETTD